MSGVYIKGMEMPLGCFSCGFESEVSYYCTILQKPTIEANNKEERRPDCPLVSVPDHGRTIDVDAFAAEMKDRQDAAEKWLREAKNREIAVRADGILSFLCELKLTLDKAPTIIPADKEAENE